MAPNRSIRASAWKDEDDDYLSDHSDSANGTDHGVSQSQSGENSQDGDFSDSTGHASDRSEGQDDDIEEDEDIGGDFQPQLADVSFGALAKAQESLNIGTNKRKHSSTTQNQSYQEKLQDLRSKLRKTTSESKLSRNKSSFTDKGTSSHRTSKHAPTIQSSKHAVSRKRPIFSPPPSLKSRDPRFDPTVTSSSSSQAQSANKAYSFLNTYRDTEITSLRTQIKSLTSNPKFQAQGPSLLPSLKRQLDSLVSQQSLSTKKQLTSQILRDHKQKEKQAIREGKKSTPFYMKKGDVRKEVNRLRLEGLGKKKREKSEKRKRKKERGKEMKEMPGQRRSAAF
ncbi:putative rrna biogenesis protein rrp36 [Phaeomoniella chlamydospora]|uniref:rRNA biogenesis protein RRP36 n=1 Tax=Phaeomoniella chlamydospora TaxID=158046 RepID=A0A0G2EGI3_PHACM|nr:putative rrna biogenesis protein rrp36 [Phaeomoniella chlamydospora]